MLVTLETKKIECDEGTPIREASQMRRQGAVTRVATPFSKGVHVSERPFGGVAYLPPHSKTFAAPHFPMHPESRLCADEERVLPDGG